MKIKEILLDIFIGIPLVIYMLLGIFFACLWLGIESFWRDQ